MIAISNHITSVVTNNCGMVGILQENEQIIDEASRRHTPAQCLLVTQRGFVSEE